MNNYVALRLLPKPDVKKPEGAGERARQLGYFPDDAVDRIAEIQRLKHEGLSMDQISAHLGAAANAEPPSETPPTRAARPAAPSFRRGAQDGADGARRWRLQLWRRVLRICRRRSRCIACLTDEAQVMATVSSMASACIVASIG